MDKKKDKDVLLETMEKIKTKYDNFIKLEINKNKTYRTNKLNESYSRISNFQKYTYSFE